MTLSAPSTPTLGTNSKSTRQAKLRTFKEKFYDAKGGRWLLGIVPPKAAKIIRTYGAAHLQIASLFNRFDRGDPRGVFNQYVMRDLSAAAYGEVALEKKYSRVPDAIHSKEYAGDSTRCGQ